MEWKWYSSLSSFACIYFFTLDDGIAVEVWRRGRGERGREKKRTTNQLNRVAPYLACR